MAEVNNSVGVGGGVGGFDRANLLSETNPTPFLHLT